MPPGSRERITQQRGGIGFDEQLGLKVTAGTEPQVRMRWTRVAIDTAMLAAAIGIDAPAKANIRTLILRND